MKQSAIQKAVAKAKGQTALAHAIHVSQGLVWQWLQGKPVHTRHFAAIERATGVSVHELLADELAKQSKSLATNHKHS